MGKKGGLVVIYDDKMLEINKTSNVQLRALYETGSGIILTIGDGDFSFSAAIASAFNLRDKNGQPRLLATSYDSQGQVLTKYTSTAGVCLETLKKMSIPVLHNIDGTKLFQTLEVNRYRAMKRPDMIPIPKLVRSCSRIIFNFPNLGNLGADSTFIHQELLRKFLIQCLPLLLRPTIKNGGERGEVHIALRNTPFYEKWDILSVAEAIGYKLHAKEVFHTNHYPGYEEQRTSPSIMRAAPPKADGASIYRFIIDDQFLEQLELGGFLEVEKIDTSNLNAYTKSIMPEEGDESTWNAFGQNPTISTTTSTTDATATISTSKLPPTEQDYDEMNVDEYTIDVFGKRTLKKKVVPKEKIQPTNTDVLVQLTPQGTLPVISPYQFVSYRMKEPLVPKSGKLPTFTVLPSHAMQYQPVYPLCPPPNSNIKPSTLLFTHKYHSILSQSELSSRNFRVGCQDLKQCVLSWADKTNTSENVKSQLKEYANEALVNGSFIIQPVRATEYEQIYRSTQLSQLNSESTADEPTTSQSSTSTTVVSNGKKIITKTIVVKKKSTLTPNVNPDDKTKTLTPSNNISTGKSSKSKVDLPLGDRLYVGVIIGILAPTLCTFSSLHSSQSDIQTTKKRKLAEQEKATAAAAAAEEEVAAQLAKKTKFKNNYNAELDDEEMFTLLGGTANKLGLELAAASLSGAYRLSFKEKEQVRKQQLLDEKLQRMQKSKMYQAQRRVQHCEERGKTAKYRDIALAEKAKIAKDEKITSAYERKQERRIERIKTGEEVPDIAE